MTTLRKPFKKILENTILKKNSYLHVFCRTGSTAAKAHCLAKNILKVRMDDQLLEHPQADTALFSPVNGMFWETEGAVSISHEWVCYPCYIILQEKSRPSRQGKKTIDEASWCRATAIRLGQPLSPHTVPTLSLALQFLSLSILMENISVTLTGAISSKILPNLQQLHIVSVPCAPFIKCFLLLVQQPRRDDLKRLSWCMFSVNLSFVYTFVGSSVPGKILKTGFVRISLFLCKLCPHCFPFSSTLVYYVECSEYLSVLIQS